jgi:hypothetical protein
MTTQNGVNGRKHSLKGHDNLAIVLDSENGDVAHTKDDDKQHVSVCEEYFVRRVCTTLFS